MHYTSLDIGTGVQVATCNAKSAQKTNPPCDGRRKLNRSCNNTTASRTTVASARTSLSCSVLGATCRLLSSPKMCSPLALDPRYNQLRNISVCLIPLGVPMRNLTHKIGHNAQPHNPTQSRGGVHIYPLLHVVRTASLLAPIVTWNADDERFG